MKLTIKEEKDVALLGRKEIIAEIVFDDKVPSRGEVREEVAKQKGVGSELVIVKTIKSNFGEKNAVVEVNVYSKVEDIKDVESDSKRLQEQIKPKEEPMAEPAKETPASVDAPKEETKAEENKEEKADEAPAEDKKEEPKADEAKEAQDKE